MTELYANRSIWRRTYAYAAVIVAAMVWGVFEIWHGMGVEGGDGQSGGMFGVLFIGGGLYAFYQLIGDWRHVVTKLRQDEATGRLTATLWEPTGAKDVSGTPEEFRNWRPHVKLIGRARRSFFIYVDHAAIPRPLRFDLPPGSDVEGLRRIAPDAVAEYQATIGKPKA